MSRPKVFVGSASEDIDVAEALHAILESVGEVTVWKYGVFDGGESALESLMQAITNFDFACFIINSNDITNQRDIEKNSIRDNVIFELGLFLGRLGRKRVFILHRNDMKPDVPSDLLGVTLDSYDACRSDGNMEMALLATGRRIKQSIKELEGVPSEPVVLDVEVPAHDSKDSLKTLQRGDTRFSDFLIDGALVIVESKHKYKEDLKQRIKTGKEIPTKYLYYTEDGCEYWLQLCQNPMYKFYHNSVEHINDVVSQIVDGVHQATGQKDIDLVSLGCGSGVKDSILLKEFVSRLPDDEIIYFYPVDISDPMIVEGMRNSVGTNCKIDKSKLRVKAIIGDITNLSPLRKVFDERLNKNVFTILGNTIGNADEKEVIDSIRDCMASGDMVLFEINLDDGRSSSERRSEIYLRHDFVPLASLGVEFKPSMMKYRTEIKRSVVKGTKTTIAEYEKAKIDGTTYYDIKLSVVNAYKMANFIQEIEERMHVKTVFQHEYEGVGLILAVRK